MTCPHCHRILVGNYYCLVHGDQVEIAQHELLTVADIWPPRMKSQAITVRRIGDGQ